jgi:hypothetical protein
MRRDTRHPIWPIDKSACEQLREQGGRNTKLRALQALINKIGLVFFCADGLVLITRISVEFLVATPSVVVAALAARHDPDGLAVSRGPPLHHSPYSHRSIIAH